MSRDFPVGTLPQFSQEKRPYADIVLKTPVVYKEESYDFSDEITAITYRSADYNGHETRVFAFLGIPKAADKDHRCPAVVLVHGGGGTADAFWVKYWVERGYAAVSLDLEGHYPIKQEGNCYMPGTDTTAFSGPVRDAVFHDADAPIERQWPYHAVTDIMLARTLIGSLEQVDDTAVGIMGFSWGGYLTSFTIGVDNRFAFAVPVYGSAYLTQMHTYFGVSMSGNAAMWEPALNIDNITARVLWFNSDKDDHFSVNATSLSYENTPGSTLLIDPFLTHGGGNCWSRPEQFVFADSVVKGTAGLIKITKQPEGLTPEVGFALPDGVRVYSARVNYRTEAMGAINADCSYWRSESCTVDETNHTAACRLPADTVAYYINIYDDRLSLDPFMRKTARCASSTKVVYLNKD